MKRTSRWLFVLPGLLLALAGCSGGGGPTIKGVVTMDGKPLADAEVELIAYDRSQPLGGDIVQTDASGRFEIKPHPRKSPLKPGKFAVLVSKWVDAKTGRPLPPEDVGMQKMAGTARNLVPSQYNNKEDRSPLSAEIKAGSNDLGTLDVKTK
jgi:hypothetical protein